jgi:hypothetical protein
MRPIVDRSREHLGATDRGIAHLRRLLLAAIDDIAAGRDPLAFQATPEPDVYDGLHVIEQTIPRTGDVRGFWKAGVSR